MKSLKLYIQLNKKQKTKYIIDLHNRASAGVQPQLIQGIQRRDGVGEGQETTA